MVILEAVASRLPIITTYNCGISPEVVKNGKEGFIIPIRDIEALEQKILYFYKSPKQVEKIGKAAGKRVENYSGKNMEKI